MKTTFPLDRMTVQEMEALDCNRSRYQTVFELCRKHKRSFVHITVCEYGGGYFYGLTYLFTGKNLYHSHSFAALRKWGVYTTLRECIKDAVGQVMKEAKTRKVKDMVMKLDLGSALRQFQKA